jgi:hypothetical protein
MKQIRNSVPGRRFLARTAASLAIACAVAGFSIHGVSASEPETAPALLFDNPYLESISPPAELAYRFEHSTADEETYGKAFADDVRIGLDPPEGKYKLNSVTLNIFTDSRKRQIGPLSDVTGNPVIMVFLERDVFQMKRRVQGSPVLFRNTIRKALRESATVEDVEIEYAGATVAAKRVTILPFDGDRIPQQFIEFRNKSYQFTVSDAVPGGFFEIVSQLPDPENQGKMLVSDRMVFTSKSDR